MPLDPRGSVCKVAWVSTWPFNWILCRCLQCVGGWGENVFLKETACHNEMRLLWRERENQQDATICLNMFRSSLCPSSGQQRPCTVLYSHPTTQRPTTATNHIQQNQRSTPHAVTHGFCCPEDGHNDDRNMLRQKLIINIWLLHLLVFSLSLSSQFAHDARS